MFSDLTFAARTLARRPGFASLAVLTVALGIGVNTAMFTIADGVLWKPLPYEDAGRLVMFNEASASGVLNCSYPNLADWKRRSGTLEDIALAREFPPATLRQESGAETIPTGYTEPNLFSVLRVRPTLGRMFSEGDDEALITERAWQRYFGSDPAIVGRRVRARIAFAGHTADSFTIVGVLPPGFRYENIDLWLPLKRFFGPIDQSR